MGENFYELYFETRRCRNYYAEVACRYINTYDLQWKVTPKQSKPGQCCDFVVPIYLVPAIRKSLINTMKNNQQDGFVYCFKPYGSHGRAVFKIGKTFSWKKRKRKYSGLNIPELIFFAVEVHDQHLAEQNLIDYCEQHFELAFGNEWFYMPRQLNVEALREIIEPFIKTS